MTMKIIHLRPPLVFFIFFITDASKSKRIFAVAIKLSFMYCL